MIPPYNCIHHGLTAAPCWNCPNYIQDTDDCKLKYLAIIIFDHAENNNSITESSYEEQMKRYKADRQKLLELSKETLVDMILRKPTLL